MGHVSSVLFLLVSMPRAHGSKRRRQQQPMFPMMMPFPGMGMINGGGQESSSSDDGDAAPVAKAAPVVAPPPPAPEANNKAQDCFARSQTFVRDVGTKDLSMMVEKLEGSLDSSWTADLSKAGLMGLIYIFSRMKPSQKMSELRSLLYDNLDL